MLGAARALGDPYNWYQAGDLTPEEASESFRVIVQDAPYNQRTCPNPAGGKIFRVNSSGKTQELGDAGDWQDPSGDATIPPIPAREGSDPDIICLASKNAANVLQLLYENITDSFNAGLDEAETATALTLTLVGLIGAEFAPITFALVTFFSIVFSVLYGTLEFVGADLWDENFTNSLVCILQGCASAVDGVVTFDWDCFQSGLSAQVTIVPLEFVQLRLFAQIEYLLLVIGGIDALNAAGATTAITDDNCDFCVPEWCHRATDETTLGDWIAGYWNHATDTGSPTYSAGVWHSAESPPRISYITLHWHFTSAITLTDASILSLTAPQTGGGQGIYINGSDPAAPFAGGDGVLIWGYDGGYVGGTFTDVTDLNITLRALDIGDPAFTSGEMQFSGLGDNPFGEDNCT